MHHKRKVLLRLKKAKSERAARQKDSREQRIKALKNALKQEDEYLEKCEKYHKNKNFVDSVQISFEPDLDVSAKTINGQILLNDKLFDKEWDVQMRYVIHEIIHAMQQDVGKVKGKVDKNKYLDDKNEQEAFTAQISYMCEHDNTEEVQEYIENLLDHHDIKGKERKDKAKKLTEDL